MSKHDRIGGLARREFLTGTAAAAAFTLVRPTAVRGSQANSALALGMIGCGGRGTWIAELFLQHGGYKFVACADYFQDRTDAGIGPAQRYTTLSGYKRLLSDKLDAVVIESPPYCHPEQAAATVAAGKHVFLAKPIAVDVPGCMTNLEAGKKATAARLVYLVDFQTRAHPFYREAARRVHRGDIGRLVCGNADYPWAGNPAKGSASPEERLRNWYAWLDLSGDFIVEQSIHTLDVATWFLNCDPIKAVGAGGRNKVRHVGNMWDHFACTFSFPNDFILSFSSVQAIPGVSDQISCTIYGDKGVADTDYYSHAWIKGEKPYDGGTFNNMYAHGTIVNIAEFHHQVSDGNYANETAPASVRSNLTAILGRTAAYEARTVTWNEIMEANAPIEPDLRGLKS
jgi:predicted dehydrogenase